MENDPIDREDRSVMNNGLSQSNTRQYLGLRVRLLRVARGWSQEVLAELAGLHRNYVGHVERGEVNVGLENLMSKRPAAPPFQDVS
ncbi:MAG: helix-turn-helix domain-containing protein [Acidobacteriaceae bacterium]